MQEDPRVRQDMARRYTEVFHPKEPEEKRKNQGTPAASSKPCVNTQACTAPLPAKTNLPKAELRCMASGKGIVVLPNPRLPRPQDTPDVHQEFPPIRARRSPVRTLDYGGDYVLM